MNVAGLIERLRGFNPELPVHLYADREGLGCMEAASVFIPKQRTWQDQEVLLISAWEEMGWEPV